MRLLKALVIGTAIMMMSQAAMSDICTTSGSVVTCSNSGTSYDEWIVGQDVEDEDELFACAKISGTWTLVGWETISTQSYLVVDGCSSAERITIVDASTLCASASGLYATFLPSDWFTQGIEVNGDSDIDYIIGSYREEILSGDGGNDRIWGNGGSDYIYGYAGTDTLYGGDGVDYIWGGIGNDTIYGNDGDDELHGDAGRDFMYGGDGDDTLWGDADGDFCWGDAHSVGDTCTCENETTCEF